MNAERDLRWFVVVVVVCRGERWETRRRVGWKINCVLVWVSFFFLTASTYDGIWLRAGGQARTHLIHASSTFSGFSVAIAFCSLSESVPWSSCFTEASRETLGRVGSTHSSQDRACRRTDSNAASA